MDSIRSGAGERSFRRRRAHTKSRRGCRNCKLRRVKCDENQPQCTKCQTFGVICNYNRPHDLDLQPTSQNFLTKITADGPFGQVIFNTNPTPAILRPVIHVGDGPSSFRMDADSLARLNRFQSHTVYTFASTSGNKIYQQEVIRFAIEYPFLMHAILTLTATHDRHLSMSPETAKLSLTEAYHWSRGAALLNKKLSVPIPPQDRDAVWAAAAMLGIVSMTSLEAATPEEAWPLKTLETSDLNWVDMSHGKEAVYKATNPMRPDSVFWPMRDEYLAMMAKPSLYEIQDMPQELVKLCELDELSTPTESPYFNAVSLLTRLWYVECNQTTMVRFLQFLNFMDTKFQLLLHTKDPRALLILAYWYGPMCGSLWWVARRARLECQAICIYLERYYGEEGLIQKMLAWPRMRCGLIN